MILHPQILRNNDFDILHFRHFKSHFIVIYLELSVKSAPIVLKSQLGSWIKNEWVFFNFQKMKMSFRNCWEVQKDKKRTEN